jgi:CubicO group peptidase (beta-lactamase class C family)
MSDERAPLESWQLGPWNRWAFQHVGEVVPTVPIPRGDGPVRELPERPAALGDIADPPWLDGLAVIHDGALVHERYANGMGPDTLHLSQSVGKSVLGLLVGVLAARGALDPAAPVSELVPEVAASGYAGATIRHLLDMTAATGFVEDYTDFWRYDVACAWHPPRPGAGAATILEFLPTIGPAGREHGAAFQYSSPSTDLLGIAAERAGGAPLAELIGRELWGPLGAGADAALAVDRAGTAVISGGVCATVRDYARLGLAVLEDGGGVVSRDWVATLGAGDPAVFARSADDLGATGYATQWWTWNGCVAARGIHGQLVAVDPGARLVVAVLSSWPEAMDAAAEDAQRRFVAAIRDRHAPSYSSG